MTNTNLKKFYGGYADKIHSKRFNSPYKVRRYAHEQQYKSIVDLVEPGQKVLDAGCGEGTLSVMLAKKGATVVGTDLSVPNIDTAKKYASESGVNIDFKVADIEALPFEDNTFDIVVNSHVLEHIPDFDRGLNEIMRVTNKNAVVAIPTILNGCSWVQVGGGFYYLKGPRSFLGLPYGFLLMILAKITGKEGVDEGYAGKGVEHIFRFPGVMRKKIKKYGYILTYQEASTLCLPYFETLLPLSKLLDKLRGKPLFRNLGYGTTFVIEKRTDK